jgi:predicted nucleic acid-binding protein
LVFLDASAIIYLLEGRAEIRQAASCLQFDPNMPFVTGDRDFHRVAGLNLHPIE